MDGINQTALFRALFEDSNDAFLIFNPDDNQILDANPKAEKLAGVAKKQFLGKQLSDILQADNEHTIEELIDSFQSTGFFYASGGYSICSKSNGAKKVNVSVRRIHATPNPLGLIVACEIATQIQAVQDQRKSSEKFAMLFEFAPDAYYLNDLAGNFVDGNSATEQLTGYNRDELIGKNFLTLDLLPQNQLLQAAEALEKSARHEPTGPDEFVLNRKDGNQVVVEILTNPVIIDNQPLVLGIARDITVRKQTEEKLKYVNDELAHVTRLCTMGEIATGLAHELNQPLAAIVTYCFAGEKSLANSELADSEQLRELFEKSGAQAKRAGEIIRRLRSLVGKSTPNRSLVDVVEPIQEVLHLLNPALRENNVSVDMMFDHSNQVVMIDDIQIQQVLVNLIRNALDSMSETPQEQRILKISTKNTDDDMIQVSVSDTGKGFPVESVLRVFDAFFSTKLNGMGMGLAISKTIIESHTGVLWMTQNSDRGTTFHFTVPTGTKASDDDRAEAIDVCGE